ncbi:MAG: hypothetical protein L0H59_10645, partial [Tomitella sp.]|nr:hypothetical protein [Tomitella sp.]
MSITQANARHRAGGTSRRALVAAATLGIVTTTVLSSTGTAFAAPQGGVTTDGGGTQGGVTTDGGGTQGGVTTPEPQPQPQPQPAEDRDYWIPPPSQEIRQAPARPNPSQTTTAPQPSTTTNSGGGGGGGGNNAAPLSNPQPVR